MAGYSELDDAPQGSIPRAEARALFLDSLGSAVTPLTSADEILSTTTRMVGEHLDISCCAYVFWLDQAGLPKVNPHKGMPMPGMVTPDQVSKAAKTTGKSFDTLVLNALQNHLDQSEDLANSEDKSGVEPQTRALALQVIRTRQAALSSMKSAS